MSFMTTTMFAPRIWGFDLTTPQAQVALGAGWRRSDLLWEGLTEAANMAWAAGDRPRARVLLRRAGWVAALCFDSTDLRRATGLVNRAILARDAGRNAAASRALRRAGALWDAHAAAAIAAMQIAPRARSSLFHLRMEALHRDTYHDNLRQRLTRIADEVQAAIRNLATGQPPGCRLFSRWRGERPTVYDDTRRVLGACLLIMEPAPAP